MRNQFAGTCFICKFNVKPMDGFLQIIPKKERIKVPGRFMRPKWRAYHQKCIKKLNNKEV
jgi:hypothetical protein